MKNSFITSIILALSLFGISFVVSAFIVRNRLDTQFPGGDFLVVEESIERTFTPRNDFLNIIFITLKNPNLKSSAQMRFNLLDEKGEVLRQIDFSGRNVEDPAKMRFQFEPISDSRGRPLTVRLEVVSAHKDPILVSVNDRFRRDLAFAAYYRKPGKLAAVKDTTSFWKGHVLGDIAFFSIWAVLLGTIALARRKT